MQNFKTLQFQVQLTEDLKDGFQVQFQIYNFQIQQYEDQGSRQISKDDDNKIIGIEVSVPAKILEQKFIYRYMISKRMSKTEKIIEQGQRLFHYVPEQPIKKEQWNKKNLFLSFQTNQNISDFGVSFCEKNKDPNENDYLLLQERDKIHQEINTQTKSLLLQFYHYCHQEIVYLQYEVSIDDLDCYSNQLEMYFFQGELMYLQNQMQEILVLNQNKFKKQNNLDSVEFQHLKNWRDKLTLTEFSFDKFDEQQFQETLSIKKQNLDFNQEDKKNKIQLQKQKDEEQKNLLVQTNRKIDKLSKDDQLFIQQQKDRNEEAFQFMKNVQFFDDIELIKDEEVDKIQKQNDDIQQKFNSITINTYDYQETLDSFEFKLSMQQKVINQQKELIKFQKRKLVDLESKNGSLRSQAFSLDQGSQSANQMLQSNKETIEKCYQLVSKSEKYLNFYIDNREAQDLEIRQNLKQIQSLIEENKGLKEKIQRLEKKIQDLEAENNSLKSKLVKYIRLYAHQRAKETRLKNSNTENGSRMSGNSFLMQASRIQQLDNNAFANTNRAGRQSTIFTKPNFKLGNNQWQ